MFNAMLCNKESYNQCYECYIELKLPYNNKNILGEDKSNIICVDKCLAEELKCLWKHGIKTTGCCCGNHVNCHQEERGYIGVIDSDIPRMKGFGYKVAPNSSRVGDEDGFCPKTIIKTKGGKY